MDRRQFLKLTTGMSAASLAGSMPLRSVADTPGSIRAVLFDAFPIFDPRPVFALADRMFPAETGFVDLWRTKQFEYTWLRTMGGAYQDFWSVTRDALRFSARAKKLTLSAADEDQLMDAYLKLDAWPDVLLALRALQGSGIRLALLSNFTDEMLESCTRHAGLSGLFDHTLSTDQVRVFKPHPLSYQLGLDTFGFKRKEIAFAAFAGWDAAGARWFGYPTFWVNRLQQSAEELGITADATGSDLGALVDFVRQRSSPALPTKLRAL